MKKLKKADLINLCEAYEQAFLNAVADLSDNMEHGDVLFHMFKDLRNIQMGYFGEVVKDDKDARLAAYYKTQKEYWMNLCMGYKALADEPDDRIEELEAKLAKAVEALDEAIYLLDPDDEDIAKETGLHRIVTTLAELKGEKL